MYSVLITTLCGVVLCCLECAVLSCVCPVLGGFGVCVVCAVLGQPPGEGKVGRLELRELGQ